MLHPVVCFRSVKCTCKHCLLLHGLLFNTVANKLFIQYYTLHTYSPSAACYYMYIFFCMVYGTSKHHNCNVGLIFFIGTDAYWSPHWQSYRRTNGGSDRQEIISSGYWDPKLLRLDGDYTVFLQQEFSGIQGADPYWQILDWHCIWMDLSGSTSKLKIIQ